MLDMLYDYGRIPGLRFSLKFILGKVPFIGWFLQLNCHLFLNRKFEDDKKHIDEIFEFYQKSQDELTFVIYPEGSFQSWRQLEMLFILATLPQTTYCHRGVSYAAYV